MKKMLLITPEIGLDKGGIQNWMFFVKKLLIEKGYNVSSYAYKSDSIFTLIKNYFSDAYLLSTWKMIYFILPFILFKNKKAFIFIHGNDIYSIPFYHKPIFYYIIKKNKNIFFISNSYAIKNIFEHTFHRQVDLVQNPFMDIKSKKHTDKKVLNLTIYFTITRLIKRKNIENTILALYELKKQKKDFKYYIAGDGPEKNNLINLVKKLNIEKEIIFLGKISEADKDKYFNLADYFLLPSVIDEENNSIEGYGIVFIEANAYKIPVLSGNTGGMVEAVVDYQTGLHCDGSIGDICHKLSLLPTIKFDKVEIYTHALKHDYTQQSIFLNFIKDNSWFQ